MRSLLRSKIHRATVTETNVEYVGSITIDADLMLEADIWPGERVLVSDLDNGARFETYVIRGKAGSGTIGINGAAAHLVEKGNRVIIMGFEIADEPISPIILVMDEGNRVQRRVRC
ncbi:MAG: aspartate 1-decarboxylase [Methanomassiliicoccales archaeon]